jgi:hypothetical protein
MVNSVLTALARFLGNIVVRTPPSPDALSHLGTTLFGCLVLLPVTWRAFELRRWACFLIVGLSWFSSCKWLYLAISLARFPLIAVWRAPYFGGELAMLALTLAMTAAMMLGWRELRWGW